MGLCFVNFSKIKACNVLVTENVFFYVHWLCVHFEEPTSKRTEMNRSEMAVLNVFFHKNYLTSDGVVPIHTHRRLSIRWTRWATECLCGCCEQGLELQRFMAVAEQKPHRWTEMEISVTVLALMQHSTLPQDCWQLWSAPGTKSSETNPPLNAYCIQWNGVSISHRVPCPRLGKLSRLSSPCWQACLYYQWDASVRPVARCEALLSNRHHDSWGGWLFGVGRGQAKEHQTDLCSGVNFSKP